MEVLIAFLMATVANTVLGVDGGVLADVQIRKLGLAERAHFWARSITLFVAACIRVAMIFAVSSLTFLLEPQADCGGCRTAGSANIRKSSCGGTCCSSWGRASCSAS